jgi:hypothetical protein
VKILKILSQHRNDFVADMECEHCGDVWRNNCGYLDNNYFVNVIPAMHCQKCGKNSAGQKIVKELEKEI